MKRTSLIIVAAVLAALSAPARALDKVTVSISPSSSSLPYFIAAQRGYFKENGIEPDPKPIGNVAALVITAMVSNQIDAAAAVVAIDGMNANLKKPGVVNWIALNAQNDPHVMEQFVLRKGHAATSLAELKGARIVSAPGIGNLAIAKAALAAAGLKDGDYTIDAMDQNQHINVLKSAQFDVAYTMEPNATIMKSLDIAAPLQQGVIARLVLGDPKAKAYMGGGAMTSTFINSRPDVARRYAKAWSQAVDLINNEPGEARKYLLENTTTPASVVNEVPLILYTMVGKLTAEDKGNLQKYVDFAVKNGSLAEGGDVQKYLVAF